MIFLVVLGALAALSPASAFASGSGVSAGDQQYVDPLAGNGGGGGSGSGSGSSSQGTSPSQPSAPASSAGSGSTLASSGPSGQTSSSGSSRTGDPSSAGTLPRTGLDVWLGAAVGALLLAAGIALRRVVSTR